MKCKICGETVKGGPWPQNTRAMVNHLAKNHPGWKKRAKNDKIGQKPLFQEKDGNKFCSFCGHKL
jgi:hypothetical protein